MSNNKQVQQFASKSGAINLVSHFSREESLQLKDAVFGTLAAWIKAENFEGKRKFIEEHQGLEFLTRLLCDSNVNSNFNMRLKKKIVNLLYDLVLNDDGIYEEHPMFVRQYFCQNQEFMNQIRGILVNADLHNMQEFQYRDSVLRMTFRLHQCNAEVVGPMLTPVLYLHRAAIVALMEREDADQDLNDMLNDELRLVDEAIAAPSKP